jgi:hypothetical protein
MAKEHGRIKPADIYPVDANGRGNHILQGFVDKLDETARLAIVQTSEDRGRVIEQTGGTAPGFYIADGVSNWLYLGGFSNTVGSLNLQRLSTISEMNLYVDNINGDDANDGSSGSPLKSLIEAETRLPYFINHRVIIRVLPYDAAVPNAGAYEWPIFRKRIQLCPIIIVGIGFQTLASGIAQAGTTQTRIVTTGGMTIDQYVTTPTCIRITSGLSIGNYRTISENTATYIDPALAFSSNVVPGDSYELVRPLIRFNLPNVNSQSVLADGIKSSSGVSIDKSLDGIFIVFANLEIASLLLLINNTSVFFFGCYINSSVSWYLRSNGYVLSGTEREVDASWPYESCPTLFESLPSICNTLTALSGCGIASNVGINLETTISGFDGFLVTPSLISARLGSGPGLSRDRVIACIRGGRSSQLIAGSSQVFHSSLLRVIASKSVAVPVVRFKVRYAGSLVAVFSVSGTIILQHVDIISTGAGNAVRVSGLSSYCYIYRSSGSSASGIGLYLGDGGRCEIGDGVTMSGGAGDFSVNAGLSTHTWAELVSGSAFSDWIVNPTTHAVTGRGSIIIR